MLRPKAQLSSVLEITPQWLKTRGIKGLLLDLDNTLVPYKFKGEPPEELVAWVKSLEAAGIRVFLVSNAQHKRLRAWSAKLGVEGIGLAGKPWFGIRKGLKRLGLSPSQVAMVGDQVFTDVLGGNLAGVYTILVTPISQKELGYTKLIRRLERLILKL
ncbi:YqeG family HAD IIIA-type phosphatase [Calidithermus timidus]|uniref:YqeG family HAD IIIA-type phosphatase n=1 Tax=Calidithermus timidus TaxID=307124 RepID=UPI00036B876E|nr:YqeG family HAD IIIA-type phosphatase [Calidithermus timidus]